MMSGLRGRWRREGTQLQQQPLLELLLLLLLLVARELSALQTQPDVPSRPWPLGPPGMRC
jgi:hypothetical protein